jgi:hypothetical protein
MQMRREAAASAVAAPTAAASAGHEGDTGSGALGVAAGDALRAGGSGPSSQVLSMPPRF